MYSIEVDTHVHTITSVHAYSTIEENARFAKDTCLKGITITDHGPGISPYDNSLHFFNLKVLPDEMHKIRIFKGAETNIMKTDGELDLPQYILKKLDWVISSMHYPVLYGAGENEITKAYINAIKNPYVDCVGHMGQQYFMCDYEKVTDTVKKYDKIIEINNNSVNARKGSENNCTEIAALCKEKEIRISVSSDAHVSTMLGTYENSFKILKAVNFPKELIVNRTLDSFNNYLEERRARIGG